MSLVFQLRLLALPKSQYITVTQTTSPFTWIKKLNVCLITVHWENFPSPVSFRANPRWSYYVATVYLWLVLIYIALANMQTSHR